MGSGTSVPDLLSEEEIKTLCGDKFDAEKYAALPKDEAGRVKKEDLLALAPAPVGAEVVAATAAAPTPPALIICKMTELPKKLEEARSAGLTPIVCDRSCDHLIDTFYQYKADLSLDVKALSLKVAKKEITLEEAQEKLRSTLSSSFQFGHDLVLACQGASPSFSSNLCFELFPIEIFKESGKICHDQKELADKVITDAEAMERNGQVKLCHEKFKIMITTHFSPNDLNDFFFGEGFGFEKMPKEWFQIISIAHEEGTQLLD
mmetsp:Transcript_19492/g.40675  ORF Transcript_19492/g.40675 Transcript_19492/m.40675 type:complete len:262 (-) Transcript_19492:54-839(-)